MKWTNNVTRRHRRFVQEHEPRAEQRPTYTGVVVAANVEYRVAGWVKTSSKTGEKYMCFAIPPKGRASPRPRPHPPTRFHSDDVPF